MISERLKNHFVFIRSVKLIYEKIFLKLIQNLKNIEEEPLNFQLLLNLQLALIKKIISIENRLKKYIKIYKIKKNLYLKEKIEQYKELLYYFRTIGDGLCFIYFDKWDIKPLTFDKEMKFLKQDRGFMGNKDGLEKEIKFLKISINNNKIAILTDITNVMRHGDICFPSIYPEISNNIIPYCMEIKSSKNMNKRIERQLENLEYINNYLANDFSKTHKRCLFMDEEINYKNEINKLIEESYKEGVLLKEIEKGLFYFIVHGNCTESAFKKEIEKIKNKQLIEYTLRPEWEYWLYHYPFTLSIKDKREVLNFMNCNFLISIYIDKKILKSHFLDKGYEIKIRMNSPYPIEIKYNNDKSPAPIEKLGARYFFRIFNEFISMEWFINKISEHINIVQQEINQTTKN